MPGLVVNGSPLASPELALVDAALAAELRRSLCPIEDSWLRPRASVEEPPDAFEEDAPVQPDLADELRAPEPAGAEQPSDYDYIVEAIEQTPAQSQRTSSHYPVLPAPEPEEAIETTDAALRRIRERLTDESPAYERKLRRRFTVASGASAAIALGLVAVDVQLQVAHLPGWLGF